MEYIALPSVLGLERMTKVLTLTVADQAEFDPPTNGVIDRID
jgi:hypothetical protein